VADYALPLQELIDAFGRLPGIGPKSAQRIAFHLLAAGNIEAQHLSDAILAAAERMTFCERCYNLAEGPHCPICSDPARDHTVVCVVEEPRDVVAIERTREFKGRYHVLGGAIDHLKGVGPEQLRIGELVRRIGDEGITEVILATNPNIEGEMTALYLSKMLAAVPDLRITKLSSGLPVGGDLEYADEMTLGRALEGRRVVDGRE
jgi:recombination protein RecR